MTSQKQIQANRRNAQKSTGPRTLRGKAISRFNALDTGIFAAQEIVPGEDRAELDALANLYTERWDPQLPEERCLVDTLVNSEWQLRRFRRIDAGLFKHFLDQYATWQQRATPSPLGAAMIKANGEFGRLQRRIDSTHRIFERTLAILDAMAAAAAEAGEVDASVDRTAAKAAFTDEWQPEAYAEAPQLIEPQPADVPQPVEAQQSPAPPAAASPETSPAVPAEPQPNQPHPGANGFVPPNPEHAAQQPAQPPVQTPETPFVPLAA
jgi:hypothetical protein